MHDGSDDPTIAETECQPTDEDLEYEKWFEENHTYRPHRWKIRLEGFRGLLASKGYTFKGAYAEGRVAGHTVILTGGDKGESMKAKPISREESYRQAEAAGATPLPKDQPLRFEEPTIVFLRHKPKPPQKIVSGRKRSGSSSETESPPTTTQSSKPGKPKPR